MALYRIKRPNILKVALVQHPANGNRWHLFKSAPGGGEFDVEDVAKIGAGELDVEDVAEMVRSVPADERGGALAGLAISLRDQGVSLAKEVVPMEKPAWAFELEAKIDRALAHRATLAKAAEVEEIKTRGLAALRGDPQALAKSEPDQRALAVLAERLERDEVRDRIAAQHAEARARPTDGPMGWLYNRPTLSADDAADAVMRLRRADPGASRPRHRGGF